MSADQLDIGDRGALISDNGQYRYLLWRTWNVDVPPALFIMLNPSTADAEYDDPTIRRCIDFSRRWGMGGLRVVNLYAHRSANPDQLFDVSDPVGPKNDETIAVEAAAASRVIAAWGATPGPDRNRAHTLRGRLSGRHVQALGVTKNGSPRHPLYVKATTEPITLWQPQRWAP